ncbi:MAG: septum site-determining protein MinC [Synergistaceae bacterium]|jgi:septum site-determining protein MinC|nr:septum site-determining protein MinC [Synergistaceae bacterium]
MLHNDADFPSIHLKGANFGIRVVFPEELPDDVLLEKFESISKETYVLPVGTGVVLDFQSRSCSEDLIGKILLGAVWPKDLNILAWIASDGETAARFRRAGFKTEEPGGRDLYDRSETLILDHSLRSGQHEESFGDVVLAGHLNSGAEIFAGGSVSVLGSLKGLVHAGRLGTEGVYILAKSFESQQLRIGDRLCSQLNSDMKWWKKPVIITLEEEGLLFRDWKMDTGNDAT